MKKLLLTLTLLFATTAQAGNVVMVAKDSGHTAFHDAVHAADLYKHAEKQAGQDGSMAPFTLFAPSNEAMNAISKLPAKKQKGLITLHVVPGQKVEKVDAIPTDGLPTVGEQMLMRDGNTVFIEDSVTKASIIGGPLPADNGVVYLIDKVLLPEGVTLPQAKAQVATPKKEAAQKPAIPSTPTPQPPAPQQATQAHPHPSQAQMVAAMHALNQSIQELIALMKQQTQVVYEQVSVPAANQSMAIPGMQQPQIVVR